MRFESGGRRQRWLTGGWYLAWSAAIVAGAFIVHDHSGGSLPPDPSCEPVTVVQHGPAADDAARSLTEQGWTLSASRLIPPGCEAAR